MPKLAFINKMDRENADFFKVIEQMKSTFSDHIIPVQLPIGAEDKFRGVVDLIRNKALIFGSRQRQIYRRGNPADMMDDVETYKEALKEAAAEADDDLLMKYLEGEELTDAEIMDGIKKAAVAGSAVFVFCGSAIKNIGIQPLMDFIVDCGPHPQDNPMVKGKDVGERAFPGPGFQDYCRPLYRPHDHVPYLYRQAQSRKRDIQQHQRA